MQIDWWGLLILAGIAFVQNACFTLTSRSRNSGDPNYHRFAAWGSNGIWFICNVAIIRQIWEPIMRGDWLYIAIAGAVYVIATAEGSVIMMKYLLKTEKGKRKVGAR